MQWNHWRISYIRYCPEQELRGRKRSDWTMQENKNIILGIVWNTILIVHGVQKGELPPGQTKI